MTTLSKILIAAVALLLLPLSAYAVGALTSPAEGPVPRRDIEVVEEQPTSTPGTPRTSARAQEPRASHDDDDDRNDKVRIVKPPPSRVPANVDDDGRRGGDDGRGDDAGDDGGDDAGDDAGDDDGDDEGDRDDGDRSGDDDPGDDDGDD